MENVKETIAKNLAELRKAHKMTQSALAEKLNYSDKAISRWEHAETLPDIETLCHICEIYGVSFEYLLKKEPAEIEYLPEKEKTRSRRILICLIALSTVWLTAILLFTSIGTLIGSYVWHIFIWAVPASAITVEICNLIWWRKRFCTAMTVSITVWSVILAVYLHLLKYNPWLLFVVGAPIQAIIVLSTNIPQKRIR